MINEEQRLVENLSKLSPNQLYKLFMRLCKSYLALDYVGLTPECVMELGKDAAAGRVVVFPCKLGDTVRYKEESPK